MKVLVATSVGQGTRATDVMRCIDGELVYALETCPTSRRHPYGRCNCGMTFRGMTSGAVTTTAIVRAVPGLDLEAYIECLDATHAFDRSWGCTCEHDAVTEAHSLMAIAGMYPEGTVVERLVDRVVVRREAGG